ncbi:hypothetical protein THASP1DRAFT_9378, partial [Thamnocephalis sphaerospora]
MSLEIFWDKLDREVALMAQELLNSRFRSAPRPDFIGELTCTHLDFGTRPPDVEILDLSDPFSEFYLPDPGAAAEPHHAPQTAEQRSSSYSSTQPPATDRSGRHRTHRHGRQTAHGPERRDTDMQLQVRIHYEGDLKLKLATDLRLNFPAAAFLSLPIELTVTSFSFSGTAVIAYLSDRVNFCFLEPDEPDGSLVQDIRVESQIGDARKHGKFSASNANGCSVKLTIVGQPVLKNVGKVERFVVDLLRHIIDEDMVFPCYSSVDLIND